MICLVNSDLGVDTPKFSRIALKRYCSLGINKPCDALLWSFAKGTVNFDNVDIAMLFSYLSKN
jgi:hypothetical protein